MLPSISFFDQPVCLIPLSPTTSASPIRLGWWAIVGLVAGLVGCGSVQSRDATQQLLMSNAIDRSIASIDFTPLAEKKVYLDTQYVNAVKGAGFVNSDYVISSLRQQMTASHCLLQEARADAEYIVEARVGTLGTDDHEIIYGIPANNALGSASSLVTSLPTVPAIPELSLAKKRDQTAAAKIGLFAYHRETREPFWQSGLAQTKSNAKDVWFFGAGPFQQGTIYDRTQFAGADLGVAPFEKQEVDEVPRTMMAAYAKTRRFGDKETLRKVDNDIELANHEEPVATPPATTPAAAAPPAATPPAAAPPAATPPAATPPAATPPVATPAAAAPPVATPPAATPPIATPAAAAPPAATPPVATPAATTPAAATPATTSAK